MNSPQTSLNTEQYWQIIKRQWLPGSIVFLSILILGVIATSLKQNIFEAEAKLKFEGSTISGSLSEVGQALDGFSPIAEKGNPIDTEAEVLRSIPLIRNTINDLELKGKKGEKLKVVEFVDRLKVSSIPATDILKVSYASANSEQAKNVVNTLVRNYLDNNLIVNRAKAVSAREFLEEQLPKAEDSLQKTEAAIRELKESNEFVSPNEDTRALIDGLQEIQSEIAQATGEKANSDSQADYIRSKLGLTSEEAVILTTISQSPEIRETVANLQQAESDLALAKAKFTTNSPNVIELEQQISSLNNLLDKQTASIGGAKAREIVKNNKTGLIQQNLTTELIQLEANNFGLQKQIDSLSKIERSRQAKINRVPGLEQKLRHLERQSSSFQSTYDVLWQQLQTVKIAESQDPGNVRVISEAVAPTRPVSSRVVGYLASGCLALLSTAGVIYLLEISDKSIKTIEEAKELYGYSSLGIIPGTDKFKFLSLPGSGQDNDVPTLIVRDYPSLPISESYRMLQSNIKSLNLDRRAKSIVITSSGGEEGKSTVAANLAAAMAQVGNKVLLVDANLHNPIQARIWEAYSDNGLSDVIADQLDPRETVSEVMPNLDLITAGSVTPSPATLLDSQRMRMLMDYWTERYDFVIFDTPSLDLTADAPIMGRMADGVMLVVRPGVVERSQAQFTKEILEQSGLNMLGIVFNGVEPQFDSRSYYYEGLEPAPRLLAQNQLLGTRGINNDDAMWETISSLAREAKKDKLAANLNNQQLQLAPLDKLETMVFQLQQDLEDLNRVVKEQEEELLLQRQKVKKLQRQANISSENKLFYIENQLNQEQEIKRMLDETLIGQRRNLEKRREALFQYQQILDSRKNASYTV